MNSTLLTLYSNPLDPNCHRVRLLAAEKEDLVDIVDVHPHKIPEELLQINPYGTIPTLYDRDVVLHDAQVIMEYIDERFPNPVLLPVDPIQRAKIRMILTAVRDYWYPHTNVLDSVNSSEEQKEQARSALRSKLLELRPAFKYHEYCMSDEYTMIDITLAPILWRLKRYEISTNDFGVEFDLYVKRIFTRKSFKESLSLYEENFR